jgi:hypothetical protein
LVGQLPRARRQWLGTGPEDNGSIQWITLP